MFVVVVFVITKQKQEKHRKLKYSKNFSLKHLNRRNGSQNPQVVDHQKPIGLRKSSVVSVDAAGSREAASHQLQQKIVTGF